MELLVKYDFGNDFVSVDKGWSKIERLYINSRAMWVNELKNRWNSVEEVSPYRDILFAQDGEFRLGLEEGEYTFKLLFYDPNQQWEPFRVDISGVETHEPKFIGNVYTTLQIAPIKGEYCAQEATVYHTGGPLAISFKGGTEGFFVSGLEVYAKAGTQLMPMYKEAPEDVLPPRADVDSLPLAEPKIALEKACEYFLETQLPDGFIGDFEGELRLWYTASYPIRTLLAGYEVLGEDKYLKTATKLLDLLISEQMPEGSFTQGYRATPTAQASEEELERVRQSNWMNLADVGSMVAALTLACAYVDGDRKAKYQSAVERYLNDWALQYQQQNGGFTNGWVGKPAEKVYSVSTATTALTAALFSRLTGETKYMEIAEQAALCLTDKWNEDGRNWNYIFDGTFPGEDHYQGSNEFGDGFYTLETLSAVLHLSKDKKVRTETFACLRKYLFGKRGILAYKGNLPWWPLQNNWHNSKSAANPILLKDFLLFGKEFGATEQEIQRVVKEYETCCKFLCHVPYAQIIECFLKDPEANVPFSPHSIQSWSGCSVAATGFAGIAYAHMLNPGMIYLAGKNT